MREKGLARERSLMDEVGHVGDRHPGGVDRVGSWLLVSLGYGD